MNRSIREYLALAAGELILFAFSAPFMTVGVAFPVAMWLGMVDTDHWRQVSVPASAVVEERHLLNSGDEKPQYEAIVIFTTANGEDASARVTGHPPRPGSPVSIRYDPVKPTVAKLSSWGTEWYEFAGAVIVGAPFLAVGVLVIIGAIVLARPPEELSPPPDLRTYTA